MTGVSAHPVLMMGIHRRTHSANPAPNQVLVDVLTLSTRWAHTPRRSGGSGSPGATGSVAERSECSNAHLSIGESR